MDKFLENINISLLQIGPYELTILSLTKIVLVIISAFVTIHLIKRALSRMTQIKKFSITLTPEWRDHILRVVRFGVFSFAFILCLRAVGISLSAFLGFPILDIPGEKSLTIQVINVVMAILVILITRIGIWYFHRLFVTQGAAKRLALDQGRRLAVYQIIKYFIYILAVLLILTSLHINLSLLIASSAALFVGIGLALQHTFDDFLSGIVILFDGTIEVGDRVVIDSLGLEGKVTRINLRSTIVETLDSTTVVVPNSQFTTTNVVNWNYNDKETRFRIKIGVAYGSNVQLVRKVLKGCAASHGLVMKSPEPKVIFVDFGNSSLDFELAFWVKKTDDYQEIKSDIRYKIDAEFKRHKIEIPFPQQDIHIRSDFRHRVIEPVETDKSEEREKTMEQEKKD